jgi:hypothetical protein
MQLMVLMESQQAKGKRFWPEPGAGFGWFTTHQLWLAQWANVEIPRGAIALYLTGILSRDVAPWKGVCISKI